LHTEPVPLQAPQWFSSFERLKHDVPQPVRPGAQQTPLEFTVPAGQHRPPEHESVPVHARPHIPQFASSTSTFEQPVAQQVCAAEQRMLHAWQNIGSSSSTQVAAPGAPQHCSALSHAAQLPQCASESPTHVPAQQRSPPSQTKDGLLAPQPPQFAASLSKSTHEPLQQVSPVSEQSRVQPVHSPAVGT
jgi:hypothetical protein